jgi:hypothetical protein
VSVDLHDNNLQGAPDDSLTLLFDVTSIDLSGNNLTSLPDLTVLPALTLLDVSGNNLDFSSLEQNIGLIDFDYTDQELIGEPDTIIVSVKSPHDFSADAGGESNLYQWKHNNINIEGANESVYHLAEANRSSIGVYHCEITNSVVSGLTLLSPEITLLVSADISGKLYITETEVANAGQVTLFRITESNGYDTIQVQDILEDGSYQFEEVLLDEYQLLGFAEKADYPLLLPTYFKQTLYWEEADTLFVDSVLTNIDILLQKEPVETPNGVGVLSGFVTEEIVDGGGRFKANKRVSKAGVSARKVERGGRGKEDLILTLVAYSFTDENGEFEFTQLPEAEYRLNVQYPGYPMDEATSIDINIGTGVEQEKRVEATVEGGKIKVRELIVTGNWEGLYPVDLYPNPASQSTTLKFQNASENRKIVIHDVMGRVIMTQDAHNRTCDISLKAFAKGIYLLNVQDNHSVVKTLRLKIF